MRLQPRPAHLASLSVVQDDGDDRGPAGEKRTHDGGGADDPRDQAEGMQGVDDVRQLDQGLAWLVGDGHRTLLTLETRTTSRLLDDLIRPKQERGRDSQAEGLGGLEVDDQLELRGLLNGE